MNIISSADGDSFSFSFPFWIPFISFFPLIGMATTSKLCWIIVMRVGILVLFLTLEQMLLVFHHWEWCLLWVCHIWPVLCWGRFPLCPPSWEFFNYKWVLNFVKKTFSAPTEMIMWLLFFNLLICCITSVVFLYIEELHSWNKSQLIMVYGPHNVVGFCLLVFCWGFLSQFSSVIFICKFCVCVWYLCLVFISGW